MFYYTVIHVFILLVTVMIIINTKAYMYPQMLPVVACTVSVECVLMLVYSIRSPNGTAAFETAPQGAIIIAAAVGSAASIAMCLGVPCLSRRLWHHAAPLVKRMNQLGLVSISSQGCRVHVWGFGGMSKVWGAWLGVRVHM